MKKLYRFLILALIFNLAPNSAYALDIDTTIYPFAGSELGEYISPLLRASIILAGVIAFLLFVGGGITMIASAGNPQQQGKGREAITAGVIGLILVVSAYWIVQIIEVLTGLNLLNPSI